MFTLQSPLAFAFPAPLARPVAKSSTGVLKPHSWTTILSGNRIRSLILLELDCGFQSDLTQSAKACKWLVLCILHKPGLCDLQMKSQQP